MKNFIKRNLKEFKDDCKKVFGKKVKADDTLEMSDSNIELFRNLEEFQKACAELDKATKKAVQMANMIQKELDDNNGIDPLTIDVGFRSQEVV